MNKVVAWVRAELAEQAGFPTDVATQGAELACFWRGRFHLAGSATAVTVARATPRLPGGRSWWHRDGLRFRQWAVERHHWPDEAWDAIGELLAEPAPDAFDINWPAHKVFRVVEVPPGARVGDTFVLGDGMGNRVRLIVVERDGQIGVARHEDLGHPLNDLYDQSLREARDLFGTQPESAT